VHVRGRRQQAAAALLLGPARGPRQPVAEPAGPGQRRATSLAFTATSTSGTGASKSCRPPTRDVHLTQAHLDAAVQVHLADIAMVRHPAPVRAASVLGRCGWFGEHVLWPAPEPDTPFRALTSAVWGAFPRHPPYGGAHREVLPT
jgi:hypothetical protein